MGQHTERLKLLLARRREKREQGKSRRMATRLAVLLGAVIALPFAYWQFQMHQVIGPAATTAELATKCDKLAATLAAVRKEAGRPVGTDRDALDYRISECEEMGVDLTTGSISDDAGD